jgi:hypothetical protein
MKVRIELTHTGVFVQVEPEKGLQKLPIPQWIKACFVMASLAEAIGTDKVQESNT